MSTDQPPTQQLDLGQFGEPDSDGQDTEPDWAEAYRRHGGNIRRMARMMGYSESVIRDRLAKETHLHPRGLAREDLLRMLPHELDGLDPLNCAECQAEIVLHPCHRCGFDPRKKNV